MLSHSQPGLCSGQGLRAARKVLCCAKGKKGPQKNEGLYFEYRDVSEQQAAVPERKSNPEEFSWVQRARGSVRRYEQVNKPPKQQQNPRRTKQQSTHQEHAQQQSQQQQPQPQVSRKKEDHQPSTLDTPSLDANDTSAAGNAASVQVNQESAAAVTAEAPRSLDVTPAAAAAAAAAVTAAAVAPQPPAPRQQPSSSKPDALQARKQQLLQRMKGATSAAAAGTAAAVAAGKPNSAAAGAAADGADLMLEAEAAAAVVAAADPQLRAFELDDETEQLLQELIDMAAELSEVPDGSGLTSILGSDPMADPLAALNPDGPEAFQGFGEGPGFGVVHPGVQGLGGNAGSSSNGSSNGSSWVDEAEGAMNSFAAELAAAKAAMQQATSSISPTATSSPDSQQQQQQQQQEEGGGEGDVVRVADLLAWEAEQAQQITAQLTVSDKQVTSMESALLVVQQEQLREQQDGDDAAADEVDDVIFGDYGDDGDDDDQLAGDDTGDDSSLDWMTQDPELLRLLNQTDAEFARLLKNMDEEGDDEEGSSTTSSTTSSSRRGSGDAEQVSSEVWSNLGVQDWLEVAEALQAAAAAADANSSSSSSSKGDSSGGGGLADLMEAIDDDASLDEAGRIEAKVRLAGVFNQDQGAAAAAAAAAASRRKHAASKSEGGAAARPGESSSSGGAPELLPRPVRPHAPSE